ncbi:MAG: aminotransferase class I/II-fold pyridoxal phosphate-dependent enzyme [Clostridia bacterium]|nr:aminotransferase class I/II-fold pyridoxal phosphate-dependent enzyme [Clostridia bacterium]
MKDFVSKKAASLQPSGIRKFFDIVQKIPGAISLGVGEPDFVTPWNVRDAAIKSIRAGYTQYTGNRGLDELRALISRYLKERFDVSYSPEHIIITVGASEAIDLSLRAVCDPGDEILIPEPSYVSYGPAVSLCGGIPMPVKCTAENDFILTPEALEAHITPKTKALILPYPNNPTGAIMTASQLDAIIPVIKAHDILVISDEIYSELVYEGRHVSIAAYEGMAERTVYIGGFSKAFAMTGWRVGFVCAPADIDSAMFKIHQYTILCAPQMSQRAAVCALKEGFTDGFSTVEEMRAEYERRGRFLSSALNGMGLTCFSPKGAFYIFASVEKTGMTGEEFAEKLLEKYKVAVVPGDAFGPAGKHFVRCSYATSMQQLSEAVSRIESFLEDIRA